MKKFQTAVLLVTVILLTGIFMACPTESDTVTYTVSFDTNDGIPETIKAVKVEKGKSLGNKLPAPTKDGCTFDGWFLVDDEGEFVDEYTATTPITASITLVAKWYTLGTFRITFNTDGGIPAVTAIADITEGQTVNGTEGKTWPTTVPTKDLYLFGGWYLATDTAYATEYTGDTRITADAAVSGTVALKAKWDPNFWTVRFNTDGGIPATITAAQVTKGAAIGDKLPAAPAKDANTFNGWFAPDGTTKYESTTNVTADIELKAKWADVPGDHDATIRTITGTGAAAVYGLYIAGLPGVSNGTPGRTVTDADIVSGKLATNSVTSVPASPVVVVVNSEKVSKVEFGTNGDNTDTAPPDTGDGAWTALTKDAANATALGVKRWTGTLGVNIGATSATRRVFVRITAEDGVTKRVYRYTWYNASAARGTLSALSIGGTTVPSASYGNFSGWWNPIADPNFTVANAGAVTLITGGDVTVSATINNSAAGSAVTGITSVYKLAASSLPLTEASNLGTSVDSASTAGGTATTHAITGLANGDYLLIRYSNSVNDPLDTTNNYAGQFGHYLIKVTIPVTADATLASATFNSTALTPLPDFGIAWASAAAKDVEFATIVSPSTLTGVATAGASATVQYGFSADGAEPTWGTTNTYTKPVGARTFYMGIKVSNGTGDMAATRVYKWKVTDTSVAMSSNANIRAVSGTGINALYGLYMGGVPGTSNGTPGSGTDTATAIAAITANGAIKGNSFTSNTAKPVVVIVEDAGVKSVRFGWATDETTDPTWRDLTRTNDAKTPTSLSDKRWVGTLGTNRGTDDQRAYVEITAENNTVQVYRYTYGYNGSNGRVASNNTKSINGTTFSANNTYPAVNGMWSLTASPDLVVYATVNLTAAPPATDMPVEVVFTGGGNLNYQRIPAADWTTNSGLLEGYSLVDQTNSTDGKATISGMQNGDYILFWSSLDGYIGSLFVKVTWPTE